MRYNLIESIVFLIEESYDLLTLLYILYLAGIPKEILYVIVLLLIWFHRVIVFNNVELNDNTIYAPAFGIVRQIQETDDKIIISTFLRPNDVHIQYMPYKGQIKQVIRNDKKDGYCYANDKCSDNNNSISTVFESEIGEMKISQISGVLARKIVVFGKTGDKLNQGDKLGFIRFGSRVDVELIKNKNYDYTINVDVGEYIKGLYTPMILVNRIR